MRNIIFLIIFARTKLNIIMRNVLLVISALVTSLSMAQTHDTLRVECALFVAGPKMSVTDSVGNTLTFVLQERDHVPASQLQVKTDPETIRKAQQAPDPNTPYYNIRMALPIPTCYTPTEQGELVGLDKGVYNHLHSAGLEALPNGDMLAIYFSTPKGRAEADTATTFVQCRLRAGSDQWDMPELFFDTHHGNDQSALLFRDGNRVWFFGGGRGLSDYVPFRICYSDDCGQTWTFMIPELDAPAQRYSAQPISNAFRDPEGNLYIASDGKSTTSFLWRSTDNGRTWHDMGGRTNSRHSTIVPLDDQGTLLSLGGKKGEFEGWNAMNISRDWGASWEPPTRSIIPPCGTAQRPCIIRLKSGALLFVSDSYQHKRKVGPPEGWAYGNECVVGISTDNGASWRIKQLPGTLPQHHRLEHPSLGYVTIRQADNGRIHVLTTSNYPGLDIEFNEAWIWSDLGDLTAAPVPNEPTTEVWTQYWPNGQKRVESTWKIWAKPRDGQILLRGHIADGPARHFDPQGNLITEYMFHDGLLEGTSIQSGDAGIQNEGK